MKKSILITSVLVIFSMHSVMSQEDDKNKIPKHEISIDMYNLLNPIKRSGVSFSYDYLLNDSESIGITPTYNQNDYSLGVNYKHFFSKKYAQGFYTEVGMTYKTGIYFPRTYQHYPYHYHQISYDSTIEKYNALDLDLKMGYKLVSKKNYFVDVFAGISKTIFGPDMKYYKHPYSPLKFGIKIGKRF